MLNPTGKSIRMDPKGSGRFNASRGGPKRHDGVDFIAKPGQAVLSPIDGSVSRRVVAYSNENYYGVEIDGKRISIILLYLNPLKGIIGSYVQKGDIVGTAQDISKRYGKGMLPHIHFRISRCDPILFMGMP